MLEVNRRNKNKCKKKTNTNERIEETG